MSGEIEVENVTKFEEEKELTSGAEDANQTKSANDRFEESITCTVESSTSDGEFVVNIPLDQPVGPEKVKKVK